ncbi:MAG TPA: adenylate/guanylate cyclase domain-containing protein, partial [Actinomycetota bacterium]|nr:adenylate/guanylate cyclase domain-containing protein [Actinomycetota bacterium]
MTELPTGTVTFLFTDIEGSTRLLQRLGVDGYEALQDEHAGILRRVIEHGGGTVVRIEGDAFFAVFPTASAAVRAAVEAQRALAAHPWPDDGVIRVRMGLHAGEGRAGGADYVGIDPNRAARIAAAGHGGQVLLSDAVRALAGDDLPDGVSIRELGPQRLKDIRAPERLFDLVVEGLPSDFPAPKTLEARPGNLPRQLTTFIGREAEMAQTAELLREHRLVTLTGTGGTGKTRLALAVGTEVRPSFPDGVFVVELASLVDAGQVLPTLCDVLAVAEERGTDLVDTLVDRLAGKRLLLILDNFEHLLDGAGLVEELLRRTADVRVVATSRAPLGLYGEHLLEVPPLGVPEDVQEVAVLSGSEAVRLFVERAGEVRSGFALTERNAAAVAGICRRLDGLPLAIELAARRISILSPEAILAHLGRRLDLLTTGARGAPPRQRTLRNAIDWSYELLDKPERRLFARLGVFVGGAELEAIEAVCDPEGEREGGALDAVASLVDHGLIRGDARGLPEPRFTMLETIREYAGDRLDEAGERRAAEAAHLAVLVELAEAAEPHLRGGGQLPWLARLRAEAEEIDVALHR